MNSTTIFFETLNATTNVTIAPLAYWHCHSFVPESVLIASTTVSLLLSLFMVNAAFGASCYFSNKDLYRSFNAMERRSIIVQYLIAMPLFELLVVWGPHLTPAIDYNSSSSVINWLVVNSMSLGLVMGSMFSTHRYRMLIHVAQCFRLPLATMYFCDRAINFTIGVEGVFIGAVFFCAMFEMVHVHQYHTRYKRPVASTIMQVEPLIVSAPEPARRKPIDDRAALSSDESSEEMVKNDAVDFSGGNAVHIYTNDESPERGDVTPTSMHRESIRFANGVPLTVRKEIMIGRQQKRIAENLQKLSEMEGEVSTALLLTIAKQLKNDLQHTAALSKSTSVSQSEDKHSNRPDEANNELESDY